MKITKRNEQGHAIEGELDMADISDIMHALRTSKAGCINGQIRPFLFGVTSMTVTFEGRGKNGL
jgi:hypothetical protein